MVRTHDKKEMRCSVIARRPVWLEGRGCWGDTGRITMRIEETVIEILESEENFVWYADYKYTNFNTFFSLVAITNKKQKWKSNAIRETDDIKA